ncbi:MAG: PAS domain-containing sensor histidine kinase [Hydrogenophaga sp.]|uniref:PAS domain-containing sensor histidine kinase n=1 Tax=Hydrogenophaga sp. TaxID=1904254 RepID=UPI001DC19578|nr:PAS domain S-box protein [Hydrogenophaga sp.]MBW0169053.1 PAS domain S-box protein [Hydrogenophaga sp.]MBW0185465.1 PAS domain S-box protein [Hydrogenophaga sp.]
MDTSICPDGMDAPEQQQRLEQLLALRTQELQAALDSARSLCDQATCGLLTFDAAQRCVHLNQTLHNWLGHGAAGAHLNGLVTPRSREALTAHVESLCRIGHAEPVVLDWMRVDGSVFRAQLASTPVFDAEGHFMHGSAVITQSDEATTQAQDGLLRSITDRIPARLAYYDKNLICRFANQAHASRYGKTPAEMVGSPLSQVVRPEILPDILPRVAQALSGQTQTFEAERVGADGLRNYFEIHYIPDFRDGAVEGIFIELHDISERRRTEEFVLHANRDLEERVRDRSAELFASEQRYRLMVDAIQDYCIYFVDENGGITEWTESAQRLHGHSRSQIMGRSYEVLLAADNAGEDEVDPGQVLRLAKAHGQWETRGWRLREDGSRFWAHTVLTALRNEAGELQGLSSITRDMTAAKSLEDVMNDLNRELEKRVAERTQQLVAANKDLDVFSHMVSHDLRAPLRHIASFVSLLQEQMGESTDALALQYQNSIAKASKRMSLMIEGLLEYARLGRVAIETQPVPISQLVQGVIAHLKQENPDRRIEWVIENDLPVVRGDAMLLAQALGNLLGNSVKYTRPRDVARIELGWKVNPVGGRTFFIADNGVGFDLEKAHNLFVMFQRQHHSMDFEGTGTGLALSQRIIERHGGRIWAETAPGEGCTFYFTLPFDGMEPEMTFSESSMAELSL